MNQPCPDCGTLMQPDGENTWRCPACGQRWTDRQIALIYNAQADEQTRQKRYDDCDEGYDPDDDWDYDDYDTDDYYQAYGWRYKLRNLRYKIGWWFWRHFKRCKTCQKRNVNCTCIPF